jgi:hypothetical protein
MGNHRSCTCHPSEAPHPCQKQYALTHCQAARIQHLEISLWDVHAYCNNWDWFIWMWPIRRIKRIASAALEGSND